jgi:hypothetical protein
MNALFELLETAYVFSTASRRPMSASSLPTVEMPAMFLIDDDESHVRGDALRAPGKLRITCAAWIFTADAQDPNAIPATTLNNILDAIDPKTGGVLKPSVATQRQTLGGLVYDCWVEGKVTKDPGVLGGLGFAHIPITIAFTQ